jgi:hypothetical protein
LQAGLAATVARALVAVVARFVVSELPVTAVRRHLRGATAGAKNGTVSTRENRASSVRARPSRTTGADVPRWISAAGAARAGDQTEQQARDAANPEKF